jgi:hypothetical protein
MVRGAFVARRKDTSAVAQSTRQGEPSHAFDDFLLRTFHGGLQLTL